MHFYPFKKDKRNRVIVVSRIAEMPVIQMIFFLPLICLYAILRPRYYSVFIKKCNIVKLFLIAFWAGFIAHYLPHIFYWVLSFWVNTDALHVYWSLSVPLTIKNVVIYNFWMSVFSVPISLVYAFILMIIIRVQRPRGIKYKDCLKISCGTFPVLITFLLQPILGAYFAYITTILELVIMVQLLCYIHRLSLIRSCVSIAIFFIAALNFLEFADKWIW